MPTRTDFLLRGYRCGEWVSISDILLIVAPVKMAGIDSTAAKSSFNLRQEVADPCALIPSIRRDSE